MCHNVIHVLGSELRVKITFEKGLLTCLIKTPIKGSFSAIIGSTKNQDKAQYLIYFTPYYKAHATKTQFAQRHPQPILAIQSTT
jgi:hypothetical protein